MLNRIGPAAVGVETPPRWFERDVYYEIAYESYGVGVPWAEEKGKEVRPIDWQARGIEFINALAWPDVEPPVELEIETGFEAEVEPGGEPGVEPEVDIPLELWDMRDFFFADTPEWRDLVNREYAYATPDPNPWNEAVRRYMLYRNLMIAREIVNLAADYEGQRVVVLIGAAHKPDLDLLLESVPNIVVRHASEWSGVSDAEVAAEERRRDHLAILWFNLAGSLVDPGDVDLDRMDDLLAKVEREAPDDPEVGFLRARRHAIAGETAEALAIYRYLAWDSEWEDRPFTYPDRALAERVNELNNHELQELRDLGVHPTPGPVELGLGNVISPVANLTIRQRILYEIAQQDEDLGARGRARPELDSSGLNSTQGAIAYAA